jgi:Transposase IS200 like
MDDLESLSHTKWECKYHVVFIPKCRRKTLYGELRPHLGEVFRKLAAQKECRVEEGHLMVDHVHMLMSIPEICGFPGGGLHQRKERDPFGAGLRGTESEFRRPALLGQRVLRVHCWPGRANNPGIHQEPGKGGYAPGANEPVALIRHLQVAPEPGGASATPNCRFERLTS